MRTLVQRTPPLVGEDRSIVNVNTALAANAGAQTIASIPVGANRTGIFRGEVRAAAGAISRLAVVAATDDTLTLVAHGVTTGTPVFVVGTSQPGGITATTIYYANAATADTIKLYDTQANAVTGGAGGLVDITSAGAGVQVIQTVLAAYYIIDCVAHNRNGKLEVLGAINKVANENVAGWDVTLAVDDTNDLILIKGTPDTVLPTRFEVFGEARLLSLNV